MPPLELWTPQRTPGRRGTATSPCRSRCRRARSSSTVADHVLVTGRHHHRQGLLGVDAQVVAVDLARVGQDVVDRALVNQAAQGQDRLQAGEVAGAGLDAEVDDEVADQVVAGQVCEPAGEERERVGIGRQVVVVDRETGFRRGPR